MAKKMLFMDYLIKSVIFLVVAGILSYIFSMIFGSLLSTALMQGIFSIIIIAVMVMMAKHVKIDNMNAFSLLVLFGLMTTLGSILTSFVPALSPFLFSITDLTISGLIMTFFYLELAELITSRFM